MAKGSAFEGSDLLRGEDTDCASVLPHGHAHFSQQSLPTQSTQTLLDTRPLRNTSLFQIIGRLETVKATSSALVSDLPLYTVSVLVLFETEMEGTIDTIRQHQPLHADSFSPAQLLLPGLIELSNNLLCFLEVSGYG